jgi:hypothetical protein
VAGGAIADTPNNWVEVEKRAEDKYVAEVGKETFEVRIRVSLANGKILRPESTILWRRWDVSVRTGL